LAKIDVEFQQADHLGLGLNFFGDQTDPGIANQHDTLDETAIVH
jgi:hypothetical protein